MSYPDLGCYAECLTCEICDSNWLLGDDDLDLTVPDDFDFGDDIFDGWEPDPGEEGGLFDDFEVPGVDLPGGGQATPDWNDGPGIQLEWN